MRKDSELLLANSIQEKMENNIFVDNVNMETKTIFMKNGNINIYPRDYNRRKRVVAGGKSTASQKGRMVTESDGTSHFKRYRHNTGSRYQQLWRERYGMLKMSKTRLVLSISVPLDMDDPMGELSWEAEQMKPENTDYNVIVEIKKAIKTLKG